MTKTKKDSNYELYKKTLSKKKYFENWDSENYSKLTKELEDSIYEKYLVKCQVMQRDNFSCQSANCLKNNTLLTLHHIKFKHNGGKDSARNCVILCETCHKAYHRGKKALTLLNSKSLPNHMRGHTFRVTTEERVNWRKVKGDMRKLRKSVKNDFGRKLTENEVVFLLRLLEMWLGRKDD